MDGGRPVADLPKVRLAATGCASSTPDMLKFVIMPLRNLPNDLAALEAESITQGFSMVLRLREEWDRAQNRFDRGGEVLLGAFAGPRLVGIGGLNIDPYLADPEIGRLRHLYVLTAHRRSSVGAALVRELLAHAVGHFLMVRLWTGKAAAFYDALGFESVTEAKATHRIVVR